MSDIDQDWRDIVRAANIDTTTQEQNVDTTQELPAVSKLREAFDTARNALIDGSELAKLVAELSNTVTSLRSEVVSLQRDLEYIRNRNRELDEQVTEVRRQRDQAIGEAHGYKDRAMSAETQVADKNAYIAALNDRVDSLSAALKGTERERDDAIVMALEYETKWKAVDAHLNKLKVLFGEAFGEPKTEEVPNKAVPHYEVQPRDEVGKFQEMPKAYDAGSQGQF
jgi:chromosome segregation ATPase